MRSHGAKAAAGSLPASPSGARPAVSPFPELRGQEEPPPGAAPAREETPSGAARRAAPPRSGTRAVASSPDLDLTSELDKLRSASPIVESMADSSLKSLALTIVRNLWLQLSLFVVLSLASVMLPMAAQRLTGVAIYPGAYAYFLYFVLATLFFTRHRYKESFGAMMLILGLAVAFHVLDLFPAFKPTPYFWLTVLIVGSVNAFYYNDYTIRIAEQNLELRALRKEVLASDRLVGRVSAKGGADEMAYVKKAQEEVAHTRAHYTSLIANLMQFGGSADAGRGRAEATGPDYAVICRAAWQLLKRGVGATRAEILFHDEARKVLYTVKAFVAAEKSAEGPFGFSAAPAEEIPAEKAKMTIPLDVDSLFKVCVDSRRMLLREDIVREQRLAELERRTPCPVHSLIPLLDGEKLLGVINMSECAQSALSEEAKTIVRTTSRLASLSLANAQTFLQTKEELEAAKVLTGEERKKRAEVLKVFKTLVSANIVEEILNDPEVMRPKRQALTIVFVDLRGFTTLSEQLDAAIVVELLDDFFETLTPLIFKYGGTLDKYIGDEIMALWGAPFARPEDTKNAVLCAVEMMSAMESVKQRWRERQNIEVAIGIAINNGEAIVGSIGSSANKNFTAIGDAVNTCARLEGLSGRDQILVTRATYDHVRDLVRVQQLPSQKVKGKEHALEIYEVVGLSLEGSTRPLPSARARLADQAAATVEPAAVQETPGLAGAAGRRSAGGPDVPRSSERAEPSRPGLQAPRPVPAQAGPGASPSGAPRVADPASRRLPADGGEPASGAQAAWVRQAPRTPGPGAHSAPGAVARRPEPSGAARPRAESSPTESDADVTIGTSRDLRDRIAGAGRPASAGADSSSSSRELAARTARATPATSARGSGPPAEPGRSCPRCRHVTHDAASRRCGKCGEALP